VGGVVGLVPEFLNPMAAWLMSSWAITALLISAQRDLYPRKEGMTANVNLWVMQLPDWGTAGCHGDINVKY